MTAPSISHEPQRADLFAAISTSVKSSSLRPILHHLNNDSSWLLQLPRPPARSPAVSSGGDAGSNNPDVLKSTSRLFYNILIDPWLAGSQIDFHPWFSRQWHVTESSCKNIQDVETLLQEVDRVCADVKDGVSPHTMVDKSNIERMVEEHTSSIDLVVISHEFTDHCHRATLEQVSKRIPVFATEAAADIIDSWHHFDTVKRIPHFFPPSSYFKEKQSNVDWRTHSIQPLPKWLSVSRLVTSWDVGYLHSAVMLNFSSREAPDLIDKTSDEAATAEAIIYTPHGIPATALQRLTQMTPPVQTLALMHGLFRVSIINMSTINLGARNGMEVQRLLSPKYWIRTHDENKKGEGLIEILLRKKRWTIDETVGDVVDKDGPSHPNIVDIQNGEGIVLT